MKNQGRELFQSHSVVAGRLTAGYILVFSSLSAPLRQHGLTQKQEVHLALMNQALCSTDMKIWCEAMACWTSSAVSRPS